MAARKMVIVMMVVIFSVAVGSFGSPLGGAQAPGQTEFTIRFDEGDLSFSDVEGYDLVEVERDKCELDGQPGTPWLPVRSVHILIPAGSKVAYVEAVVEDEIELEGQYKIYPAQRPHVISHAGPYAFDGPDAVVYASSSGVRPQAAELVDTVIVRGYHMAVVRVWPLDYVPVTGRLTLRRRINLSLVMETDAAELAELAAKKMRYRFRSAAFEGLIKANVINPQALKADYNGAEYLPVSQGEGVEGISPAGSSMGGAGESLLMEQSGGGSRVDPNEVRYLLIGKLSGPKSHEEEWGRLVDWKRRKGIPAEGVDVSWIYSHYSGNTNQQKIKACIKDYVQNRGTEWVLLAGDNTIVPDRDCYGFVDIQPEPAEDYTIPTDLYYAGLDDMDWNDDSDNCPCEREADGDTVDLAADVFVGRLPVRSQEDANAIVSKILQYEKGPLPSGFGEKMLLSGVELWSAGDAECKSESMYISYIEPYWDGTPYRFYDTATDFEGGAAYDVTVEHINDQLKNGYNFFHMATHGDWPLWQTEVWPNYHASDALDVNNVDKYANVATIACNANGFDNAEPCLSEGFIRNSKGGTVSYIGASRYGLGIPGQCWLGPSFQFDAQFYEHLFNEEDPGHMWQIGRPYNRAKDYWVGFCNEYGAYRWLMFCINLVADPEMRLHTETPVSISVTATTLVFDKPFRVDVSSGGEPVEDARVAISHPTVEQDYWIGHTDANGVIVFSDIHFTNPNDEYDIVVTAYNYVAYEDTMHGYASVQAAVDAASDFDEIVLAPDSWYESIDFTGKAITLRSMYPQDWQIIETTIIDANGAGYGVVFESGEDCNSVLKGLTVTNASTGVYVNGDSPQNGVWPVVTRCILQGNDTGLEYGQRCDGCLITHNIIRENTDHGISGSQGEADIISNWIYDNGAGIKVSNSSAQIYNNTIIDNTSAGIEKFGGGGTVTISNCILWGNGDDLDGCSATYSCIKDWDAGEGNIHTEPYFVDPNTGDFHLHQHSPCIDAGDPNGDYEGQTDIDGQGRVVGVSIDMGADEFRAVHNITKDIWYVHIQEAISVADNGDEIVVSPGRYYEKVDYWGLAITVRSINPDDLDIVKQTIIDGNDVGYAVNFGCGEGAGSVLKGFTVTGGNSSGIYCRVSGPTISHCIVRDNRSWGVYGHTSTATIKNCWIYGNGTTGVYSGTISGEPGRETLVNNTIAHHPSLGINRKYSGSDATVTNCIVWGNAAPQIRSGFDVTYSCVATSITYPTGYPGEGNISSDPQFVDGDNGDYHLSYGSACINAGDPNGDYSGQTDIDGQSRVILGRVDMGADEVSHVHNLNQDRWYDTIQEAIDEAEDGETVIAYPATYPIYRSWGLYFDGKAITVRSSDPYDWDVVESTILDANSESDAAYFIDAEGPNTVLMGFTLTTGLSSQDSGVYCRESSPTISRCIIRDNGKHGIYCREGAPTISHCIIRDNADRGIAGYTSKAVIENNWIYNNNVGVYSGRRGYVKGEEKIANNTIVNNTSYGIHRTGYGTKATVTNCIVWGNGLGIRSGFSVTYSCVQGGYSGEGNINTDPNFVDPNSSDYHLSLDSPCVNAGDPNGDYTGHTDIDGDSRLADGRVDMGADEVARVRNITQGKSYLYIQDAVEDAEAGDEIVASPGTYYENIDVTCTAVTIRSTDPEDLDIVRSTIIYGSQVIAVYFRCIGQTGSAIKGFTITGTSSTGIRVTSALPTISNCIVRDISGYGIGQYFASPTIENCWIYGNDNGIYLYLSNPTLINNTVADNANYGIYREATASPTITNCIAWNNGDEDSDNIIGNPTVTYSCVQGGYTGTGNISSDPNFVDPNSGDYHITAGSGCIDAADGDVAPAADMFGQARYDDPSMPNTGTGTPNYADIGAHEYKPD